MIARLSCYAVTVLLLMTASSCVFALPSNTSSASLSTSQFSQTLGPPPPGWPSFEFNSYDLYGYGNGDANALKCNALGRNFSCSTKGQCYMCSPLFILSDVSSVSTARGHTLVVLHDGTLVGSGTRALLGVGAGKDDASCVESFVKIPLPGGSLAAQVSSSATYSAVLTTSFEVFVFGYNTAGVFGSPEALLPHVGSPMRLNLSAILNDETIAANDSIAVAASVQTLFVMLSNGSVVNSGSGILRGPDAAAPNATLFGSIPCPVQSLHLGVAHAFANCTDGTIVGWGSNDEKQIANSSVTDITIPVRISIANSILLPRVVSLSLGAAHSVAVLENGVVYGRGSNSDGELGFPSTVVQVDDWAQLRIPLDTTYLLPQSAVAGSGYTTVVTKYGQQVIGTSAKSNIFTTGSNSACGLGIGKGGVEVPNVFSATVVPFTMRAMLSVAEVVTGDYRRNFLLVKSDGTSTASSSIKTATPSVTRTHPESASLSNSQTITPPETHSHSRSRTLPSTRTATVPRSVSESSSISMARTLSAGTESHVHTQTVSLPQAPQIVDVRYTPANDAVAITFDNSTDQFDDNTTQFAKTTEAVDAVFRIQGELQSFGRLYSGEWITPTEFVLLTDKTARNITHGVAFVCVAFGSNIRNSDRTSLPSNPYNCVEVRELVPAFTPAQEEGLPTSLIVAIIILCSGLGLALLVGLPLLVMRQRAKRAERIRARENVVIAVEPQSRQIYYNEPIEDTVTFSSVRRTREGRSVSKIPMDEDREVQSMSRVEEMRDMQRAQPQEAATVEESVAASPSPSPQRSRGVIRSGTFVDIGRSPNLRRPAPLSHVLREMGSESSRYRIVSAAHGDGEAMLPSEGVFTVEEGRVFPRRAPY